MHSFKKKKVPSTYYMLVAEVKKKRERKISKTDKFHDLSLPWGGRHMKRKIRKRTTQSVGMSKGCAYTGRVITEYFSEKMTFTWNE